MLRFNSSKPISLALVTLLGLLIFSSSVQAQTGASLTISPPQLDEFPTISFSVSVSTEDGQRIDNLPASSFQIIEDETSISPAAVEEVEVGTRQLFIINTNEAMGLRDANGRTRLFFVRQALLDWWTQPQAAQFATDDLTLITGSGPLVEHGSATATMASALSQYQPEFVPEQANFELLLDSLSYLDDASAQSNMPSYVMFFTTVIGQDQELALTNTIARAQELGATIFPVLVNPPEDLEQAALTPLTQLAEGTNGRLIVLDGTEPGLTDLRQQVIAQRTQYQLSYSSNVNQTGTHQLQVRVTGPGLIAESEARSFPVQVQPPEVTFIQPPLQIERASDDPSLSVEMLPPTERPLQILVNFPDNHPRPLVNSQLLANGETVSERLEPPFDQFAWDLSGYAQDEAVELQAQITDSLGLQASTMPHTVQVAVEPPPGGLAALEPALIPLALIIAFLIVAVIVAVTIMNIGQRSQTAAEARPGRQQAVQPFNRARLQNPNQEQAEAYLIPLLNGQDQGEPIPLVGVDITLGADASLSAFPLRHPSVSGLHARLIRQAGGDYLLRDQGSTAGTWVNFQLVPEEGVRLKAGDQIHLGRLALRFVLPQSDKKAETRVEKLESFSSRRPRNEASQ